MPPSARRTPILMAEDASDDRMMTEIKAGSDEREPVSLLRLDPERDALRVLLVEDDEDDYVFIKDLLDETSDRRYRVEWVDRYDEAFEAMAERRHHLYLLDYRLGARTGVELLEEEALQDLAAPAIVLTGVGDREADEAAMRAGASDFLTKGRIDASVLERTIRYSVEGKRQEAFQRFLADATRTLNASLEYETAIGAAARLMVPELGEWSCVCFTDDRDRPPAAEAVHADPTLDEEARRLAELISERGPSRVAREVMARGGTVMLHAGREERLGDWFAREADRSLVEKMGVVSAVAVPLRGKGRVRGILILASSDSRRRFREVDRPFFEELGRRVGLALENARLFEAAREATRIRDDVLSMVSHDLGNPLAAISIAAARIEKHLGDAHDDEIPRFVEMIRSASDSMERLIEDLLDVRRIETGHFGIDRRPEEVGTILDRIAERFGPHAEAREIGLDVGAAEPVPDVMVDRERVIQVLSNLLNNALKFTSPGGSVRVRACSNDGEVRISVSDTGVGMNEEELEHLFDRFWQAHRHRRAGAGLGLTITKEIVEAHGGRIWAESREGEGSTFSFTLPVVDASDLERG